MPHSHTDIGYTHLQPEVEQRQVENLAKGIAFAEKTASYPEGARFVWNVEVLWAADLFLQRMEAPRRAAFDKAVKSGQVGLNGLYLNVLSGLARPEELVQAARFATQLSERLGVTIDTAMISDIPGHTWGLVPALAQAGIRYLSTSPNFFDRIGTTQVASADQPFWWVGPSGPREGADLEHVDGLRALAHVEREADRRARGRVPRSPRAGPVSVRHHLHPLVGPRRQLRARGRHLRLREGLERPLPLAALRHQRPARAVRGARGAVRRSHPGRGAATGRPTGKTARARRRARPR